jgi:hypothetical protein
MSSFIFRDSSQVVAAQGDKISFLSQNPRAPPFENFKKAAPNSLRRKEFGKAGDGCRVELFLIRPVCLR